MGRLKGRDASKIKMARSCINFAFGSIYEKKYKEGLKTAP